jgi:hypothetical protein
MKIRKVIGVSTEAERTAVGELVTLVERGGPYSAELLDRLPSGRVEIHVTSNADDAQLAVIVIENGVLAFYPLDATESADAGARRVM